MVNKLSEGGESPQTRELTQLFNKSIFQLFPLELGVVIRLPSRVGVCSHSPQNLVRDDAWVVIALEVSPRRIGVAAVFHAFAIKSKLESITLHTKKGKARKNILRKP